MSDAVTRPIPVWIRIAPLVVLELYLTVTVCVFAFGPWDWPVDNPVTLYGYLVTGQLCIALGYLSGAFGRPRADKNALSPRLLLAIGIVVNLLLIGPTMVLRSGGMNLMEAIQNPGAAYFASADTAGESRTALEIVRLLLGPAIVLLLPITMFYWERFSRLVKWIAVVAIVLNLGFWVMTGTNRGLADFIMYMPCLLMARMAAGKLRLNARQVTIGLLSFATMIVTFVAFFTAGQNTRIGSYEIPDYFPGAMVYASSSGPIMSHLSPPTQGAMRGLSMYASQGYYGLSLALEKPFIWSYGIGHSNFLVNATRAFTGSDAPLERSYPGRLDSENGWLRLVFWHSIYPWLASDVGFPGALLVIMLLARLFALVWVDTAGGGNPLAVPLLTMSITTFAYLPATNMVLGNPETFSAFYVLLLLWWWRRRRGHEAAPGSLLAQ